MSRQATHTDQSDEPAPEERPQSALIGDQIALSYPESEDTVVECERLDIPDEEITGVVGPNGSGKSTLLKALSNQLTPDTGTITFRDRDLQSYGRKELSRELGFLAQENQSLESITVRALVAHGRYPHQGFFDGMDTEDHAAIERALELAGISHLSDHALGQLSGGQKQLAWIAMVLAQDTDLLLLDEPTTFLDLYHQHRVLETVRRLNEERGVTVAIVLHDIAQAARFADYLVVMCDGEPYNWGPPDRVVTEELLADVFSVEARVEYEPELQILAERALPDGPS